MSVDVGLRWAKMMQWLILTPLTDKKYLALK